MSRIFTADMAGFSDIIAWITEGLRALDLGDETVNTAHVIGDEFITNIIKNAYQGETPAEHCIDGVSHIRPLQVSYRKTAEQVAVELTDWGRPFNPLDYAGDSGQAHGGFGIDIARNLADTITYDRRDEKNILTFYLTVP